MEELEASVQKIEDNLQNLCNRLLLRGFHNPHATFRVTTNGADVLGIAYYTAPNKIYDSAFTDGHYVVGEFSDAYAQMEKHIDALPTPAQASADKFKADLAMMIDRAEELELNIQLENPGVPVEFAAQLRTAMEALGKNLLAFYPDDEPVVFTKEDDVDGVS